jgi:GR25 family glycosyltransferase involved in LPS biosynthesis
MSHIAILERLRQAPPRHTLVLEDDFCFTSDLARHLDDLRVFVDRAYDYWVCLLGTSKYGPVVDRDDLVSYSLQPCTNTEGYLVSPAGIEALLPVWRRALESLVETRDCLRFAVDRSWSELQASGKFLVFRRKMGFQASSLSCIEREIARYFD